MGENAIAVYDLQWIAGIWMNQLFQEKHSFSGAFQHGSFSLVKPSEHNRFVDLLETSGDNVIILESDGNGSRLSKTERPGGAVPP